jgi:hypothetical protein
MGNSILQCTSLMQTKLMTIVEKLVYLVTENISKDLLALLLRGIGPSESHNRHLPRSIFY